MRTNRFEKGTRMTVHQQTNLIPGVAETVNPKGEGAREIRAAVKSDVTVLISGPTGSGKSTLARQIHEASNRRAGPFVTINLATLHENTLESELFGHERGAFTGADTKKRGKLELAANGTLFLDEVAELSLKLQARLLEFLQSKTIVPMGGLNALRVNTRIIAATHQNLERLVAAGKFREDLFHRLRVLTVELPALSALAEGFGDVVHRCLEEICAQHSKPIHRIDENVAEILEQYAWPGNFRELRHVLETAVLFCEGESLSESDLPEWFRKKVGISASEPTPESGSVLDRVDFALLYDYSATMAAFERAYLRRALTQFRGRLSQTARKLKMNKTTLLRRIRAYDLGRELRIGREFQG